MTTKIPDTVFDKHVVIFGMTGSGKTSIIKSAIVEPDLEADRRVIIITPKDDWWGLRLSKTGKSPAYNIPIFGGWHADYPLNVKDAALLAETYATMKGSAIFCTSRMSGQERATWFAAFAERLLSHNKGWVRVVIDEAHVFMPKQGGKGGGSIPLALHAGNELVSQGRSVGLRIVLASQRSAKLHNDASTQCSCLMAMLLMGPTDRAAVTDWIEDQADPVKGKEITSSLSGMKPGQAWVWAPGVKFLDRVQFARPATFDSSAAPDDDAGDAPTLKPINLDKLKGALATVEAERKANDPKELKAEVARLTRELAANPAAAPTVSKQDLADVEKRGFDAGTKATLKEATRAAKAIVVEALSALKGQLAIMSKDIAAAVEVAQHSADDGIRAARAEIGAVSIAVPPSAAASRAPESRPSHPVPTRTPASVTASSTGGLPKGEALVLATCAQQSNGSTRARITVVTGYKSSTRNTYIQRLRERGYVTENAGRIVTTHEGIAALGDYEPPPTGVELQRQMLASLPEGERKVLGAAISVYPSAITREELTELTGYKASTRNTYIQRLGARELVQVDSGLVTASADLFG